MGDKRMALLRPRQSWRLRQATIIVGFCLTFYVCLFAARTPISSSSRLRPTLTPELLNNLSLNEDQCNAAFPRLTKEIENTVAHGPFVVKQLGDTGPLQGRIKNGKVCLFYFLEHHEPSFENILTYSAHLD